MEQKSMEIVEARIFIEDVKEAIMNVASMHNIIMGEDEVDTTLATVLIHTDENDIGGDYGSVELRVYWHVENENPNIRK